MHRLRRQFGAYCHSLAHAGDECLIALPRRLEEGAWGLATDVACQQDDDHSQTLGRGLAEGKVIGGWCLTTRLFAMCPNDDTYALSHLAPRFLMICDEPIWLSAILTALLREVLLSC